VLVVICSHGEVVDSEQLLDQRAPGVEDPRIELFKIPVGVHLDRTVSAAQGLSEERLDGPSL